MKRLSLIRHSRAGQTAKKLTDDHERPLTKKGEGLCEVIQRVFSGTDGLSLPDRVLLSTSRRTVQTADRIFRRLFHDADRELRSRQIKKLYLADPSTLLDVIRAVDNDAEHVALIAHNPGLHQLAMDLAGEGDVTLYREMRASFPPPCLAHLEFDVSGWQDIQPNGGMLKIFMTGKS